MGKLREFVLKTVPRSRIEQGRAIRGHLARTLGSVRDAPIGMPQEPTFARTSSDAIRSFRRLYDGLGAGGAREAAVRSLVGSVLVDNHYWATLESPFFRLELGDEIHAFALGAARYGAGDLAGAAKLFHEAANGENAPLARLCAARCATIAGDESAAKALLESDPSYLPARQELAALDYRCGRFQEANARLDAIRAPLERAIRASSRYENVPWLDREARGALKTRMVDRPRAPRQDAYSEALAAWSWRDAFWHMTTLGPLQHGLGWVCSMYESIVGEVLAQDSQIDTVINFGVLCAEPDARVAARHPDKTFLGVDRENTTKELNEAAYGATKNLRFVAGRIDHALASLVVPGKTLLFHSRTAAVCYPQFLARPLQGVRAAGRPHDRAPGEQRARAAFASLLGSRRDAGGRLAVPIARVHPRVRALPRRGGIPRRDGA